MKLPFQKKEQILLVLAPIAGYSDLPFRRICREQGADYTFTEMVSANSLFYGNKKAMPLITTELNEKDAGVSVQVFGSNLRTLEYSVEMLEQTGRFNGIDFNMGCWVRKVIKAESGCFLMHHPERAEKIFKSLRTRIKDWFSVKIRLGFEENERNYMQIGKIAQECGLDFITVHGRTRHQGFSGDIDYRAIAEMAENLSIPVIGNGNVADVDTLNRMMNTGVAGIMIARAAIGNPFVFRELSSFLKGSTVTVSSMERVNMMERHGQDIMDYYGVKKGVKVMRKCLIPYIHGLKGANSLRNDLAQVSSEEEFKKLISLIRSERN